MTYLWARSEGVPSYVGQSTDEDNRMWWNDPGMGGIPLPIVSKWNEITLAPFKKKVKKKVLDVYASATNHLISDLAADKLKNIWTRHADLYPVRLTNIPNKLYYMVVIRTKLDCLIREKSKGILSNYGPNPDRFTTLQEWTFDEKIIADNDLFVIPDSPTAIYASERFKERIVESGLKGFCLKNYFSEFDPWVS